MAAAAKKPGLAIVFGGGKPPAEDGGDDEHAEAKGMLEDALKESGMESEAASTVVDALHSYILACLKKPEAAEEAAEDEEEY